MISKNSENPVQRQNRVHVPAIAAAMMIILLCITNRGLAQGPALDPAQPKNPLQVALFRWYEALNSGAFFNFNISNPGSPAFDGANMWVNSTYEVLKFRPSDGQVQGRYAKPAPGGYSLAFDGLNMWATTGSDSVTKFRGSDGTVLGVFLIGPGVGKLAFDGAYIWVTNMNGVTKVAMNGSIAGTFALPGIQETGGGIAFDGRQLWVSKSQSKTVARVRVSDGSVVANYSTLGNPAEIVFDGSNMWITQSNGPCVLKWAIDLSGQWCFNGSADRIAFDGANIWTTSWLGRMTKRRASDGALLWSLQTNSELAGIGFDGANMWTSQLENGIIVKK